MIYINGIIRLLLGIGIFAYLKKKNEKSIAKLIAILLILNFITCNDFISKFCSKEKNCCMSNQDIKEIDGIITLFMYCYFMILFESDFEETTKIILLGFILWRAGNIIQLLIVGETDKWTGLDLVSSIMFSYLIHKKFKTSEMTYLILCICFILIKFIIASLGERIDKHLSFDYNEYIINFHQ